MIIHDFAFSYADDSTTPVNNVFSKLANRSISSQSKGSPIVIDVPLSLGFLTTQQTSEMVDSVMRNLPLTAKMGDTTVALSGLQPLAREFVGDFSGSLWDYRRSGIIDDSIRNGTLLSNHSVEFVGGFEIRNEIDNVRDTNVLSIYYRYSVDRGFERENFTVVEGYLSGLVIEKPDGSFLYTGDYDSADDSINDPSV